MHSMMKRELFGGALRCAGLTLVAMPSIAHADFQPQVMVGSGPSSYTMVHAQDEEGTQLLLEGDSESSNAFALPMNYSGPGGTITAYASSTVIAASITIGDTDVWGQANAAVRQYFSVDDTTQVLIEWELEAATPVYAWVYLSDAYLGGFAAGGDVGDVYRNWFLVLDGSGAMTLTLHPNVFYRFNGWISTWFFTGLGDVSFRMSIIPSPGAFGLIGLGIATARRRRRE